MYSVFDDKNLNCKSLIVTVVDNPWTKRLFDEPELIVIKVIVSLVTNVQAVFTPPTTQDDDGSNAEALIKFSQVYIFKDDPICVAYVGVTTKVMLL